MNMLVDSLLSIIFYFSRITFNFDCVKMQHITFEISNAGHSHTSLRFKIYFEISIVLSYKYFEICIV